jgi:hypothetical protein
MAILQALMAAVFRSAGKLLNTAFGWATVLLFGRVPEERQTYLSIIAFGSVVWLIALVAIAVPSVGTFLLAFVTLPSWVDPLWVRIAMLVAALVIPAAIGWFSTRLVEPGERPPTLKAIARGYPYTVGLALTLVVMTLFAPVLKLRMAIRRCTTEHVPVIIPPEHYLTVVGEIETALAAGGMKTTRHRASWMLRAPTKLLTFFARHSVGTLVADQLTRLVGPRIEVLIHPSDLVVSGPKVTAGRARAILAERLTTTRAYLTWSKEGNELEDEVRAVWRDIEAGAERSAAERLRRIEERLRAVELTYEEWEVVFREALMAERALLRGGRDALRPTLAERLVTVLAVATPIFAQAEELVAELRSVREARTPAERPALPAQRMVDRAFRDLSGGDRGAARAAYAAGALVEAVRGLTRRRPTSRLERFKARLRRVA